MVTWSEPADDRMLLSTSDWSNPLDRMLLSTSDWSNPLDAASTNLVASEHRRRASVAGIVVMSPGNTMSTLGSGAVGDHVGEVVVGEAVGEAVVGDVVGADVVGE
jgi:hypothetical protein